LRGDILWPETEPNNSLHNNSLWLQASANSVA